MKFLDMLRMSGSNLWKRKVRTFLTVLGVVIGVASIVVMVSLGIGLKASIMSDVEAQGNLTTIEVSAPYNYDSSADSAEEKYLSEATVDMLQGIEHVKKASPQLDTNIVLKSGRYISQCTLSGLSKEALESVVTSDITGSLPDGSDGELDFFYGNQIITTFYVEKTGEMPYYDSGELPPIDLMNDPISVIFDMDAYYNSQNPSEDGTTVKKPKKYIIPTSGTLNAGPDQYFSSSYSVYCDIDELETKIAKIFRGKTVPGQPVKKSGRPYSSLFYSKILVEVDSMDDVESVQSQIQEMGYETYSDAEWVKQEQTTLGYIQAVLGGIGAVSLLVAAIGIANTMMMSIYERTKEIGIMKVLGCDMKNIRTMFLMEAGYIGLFGGLVGIVFSYLISVIVNHAAGGFMQSMSGTAAQISQIPPWLALLSIVFAVVIGMLAGFFPAKRAMKLSPLAAIKNE